MFAGAGEHIVVIEDINCKLLNLQMLRLTGPGTGRRGHGMYAAGPGTSQGPRVSDWTTEATDVIERTVGAGARPHGRAGPGDHARRSSTACSRRSSPSRRSFLLTIGAFRGLVLIEQGYTWAAWLTLGGIFVIAGAFCWTKRNP